MNSQPSRSTRALAAWTRFAMRLWGPADVGRPTPMRAIDLDPACPRCGSPESAHERFVTAQGKRLRRCPAAAA